MMQPHCKKLQPASQKASTSNEGNHGRTLMKAASDQKKASTTNEGASSTIRRCYNHGWHYWSGCGDASIMDGLCWMSSVAGGRKEGGRRWEEGRRAATVSQRAARRELQVGGHAGATSKQAPCEKKKTPCKINRTVTDVRIVRLPDGRQKVLDQRVGTEYSSI